MIKVVFGLTFLWATVVFGEHTLQHEYDEECAKIKGTGKQHTVVPGSGCTRFISCNNGTSFGPQDCPIKTLFSSVTDRCEDRDNVTCSDTLGKKACKPKVIKGSCNNYTVCSNGREIPMNCGDTLVYSLTSNTCVYLDSLVGSHREECMPVVDRPTNNLPNLPVPSNQNSPPIDTPNQNGRPIPSANQNNPSMGTANQNNLSMGTANQNNPSIAAPNQNNPSDLTAILNGKLKPSSNQNALPMASTNQDSQPMPNFQNSQPMGAANENKPSIGTPDTDFPMAPANFS